MVTSFISNSLISCSCVCSFEFVVFIVEIPNCRSAALPGKKRRKRSRTCCCSRRKKWRNGGEQRRRNRAAEGHWKSLQLAGGSEEEYESHEKHRKAVALLREPPEVAATEDPATLNCCRNFAPLPSPALRVEVFPRRKPPAAGGCRRDWRLRVFASPSGRHLVFGEAAGRDFDEVLALCSNCT
nr:hypothetical protein Iba_chr03cCG7190 [Ipomoea batatas]